MEKTMRATYDIFARKEHAEPLLYIGSVKAENAGNVTKACLKKFGPVSDWLEMVAAPHQKVIVVFPEKEEAN